MNWRLVVPAGLVVATCVICMTVLAVKGLIPATVASGAAAGVIGLFNGWLLPPPAPLSQAKTPEDPNAN